MILFLLAFVGIAIFAGWYFWKRRPLHRSVSQILGEMALILPLKDSSYHRYPSPTVVGDFFGFRLHLEGGPKRGMQKRGKGFRFLATIELPKVFSERLFLQSEQRRTSLKPIVELKWVSTGVPQFDQNFLLLTSSEKLARAVFQPYLCEKILSLGETNWQLDVHGKEALFEVWQSQLNAHALGDLLKMVIESLNALFVASDA